MIVDLEKLKEARTALGIIWTTMSGDSYSAPYVEFVRDLLRDVIDDLEIYGHSTLVGNPEDRIIKSKEGDTNGNTA